MLILPQQKLRRMPPHNLPRRKARRHQLGRDKAAVDHVHCNVERKRKARVREGLDGKLVHADRERGEGGEEEKAREIRDGLVQIAMETAAET